MNRLYLIFITAALMLMLMLAGCGRKVAGERAEGSSPADSMARPSPVAAISSGGDAKSAPSPASPPPKSGLTISRAKDKSFESRSEVAIKPGKQTPTEPRKGLLTAGEWNDNKNYKFLLELVESNPEWKTFAEAWEMNVSGRIIAQVNAGDKPMANAIVQLIGDNNQILWTAKTDNTGAAYLFNGLKPQTKGAPKLIRVTSGQVTREQAYNKSVYYAFNLPAVQKESKSLDFMLVVDTTGSMGDELEFLKTELDDVIKRIRQDNANIPVRLSVNFYRDLGDEYVVRSTPFKENIKDHLNFLKKQSANGGGDYEEAVEQALADAIRKHSWNEEATARIIFMVLDAPPHNTKKITAEMHSLIEEAAAKGIRIIPVASSGVDKNTEFLLRSLALGTGGTYVFLTDHSGVGNSHLKPTIGDYEVELLNDLLVRLANQYLR